MKKFIFFLSIISLLFISCENEKDVKSDIDRLRVERSNLEGKIENLNYTIKLKSQYVNELNEKIKELDIYNSGRTPKYILKLRLKQSHFSLDIDKHIKDSMNSIEFSLAVDKDLYNQVSINDDIVNKFRSGSLFIEGSLGNWKITVIDKILR